MKRKKLWRSVLAALLAGALAAPAVFAEELPEGSPEGEEVNFWLKFEDTNISELQAYKAMKYAASILTDGERSKISMDLEYAGDLLLSGSLYGEGSSVLLSIPELTDTVFFLDLLEYQEQQASEFQLDGMIPEETPADEAALEEAETEEAAVEDAEGQETEKKYPAVNPFEVLNPEETEAGEVQTEDNGTEGVQTRETGADEAKTEDPQKGAMQLWDSWDLDYEALAERYLKYCGKTIQYLGDSIIIEELPETELEVNGESVLCQGTSVEIPRESLMRLADATIDFAFRDRECRGILEQIFGEKVDFERDAREIQETIYQETVKLLSDISVWEYQTPENETALLSVSMNGERNSHDGYCLQMNLRNRGGKTIDENFDLDYTFSIGKEAISYNICRDVAREGSVVTNNFTGHISCSDSGSLDPEYPYADSQESYDFTCVTSYDEDTADYTLLCTVNGLQPGEMETFSGESDKAGGTMLVNTNLFTLTSYGTFCQEGDQMELNCENITWMSGSKYLTASAGAYGGIALSGLSFDGDPARVLDILKASEEELSIELENISHNFQVIMIKLMFAQGAGGFLK
ncbi:MAG: hypothetical protein SOZ59_11395 [Candidatus Limivivens sp.]|nr:hypothetical protein [Candidatus Limivivens sp.]